MASTYHPIYGGLWTDVALEGTPFEEKGFFAFLCSNDRTKVSGIYRVTDAQLVADTGLSLPRVRAYLQDLGARRRIVRDGAWLFVRGYLQRQPKHDNLLKAVQGQVSECSSVAILEAWGEKYPLYRQWSTDRLATVPHPSPNGRPPVEQNPSSDAVTEQLQLQSNAITYAHPPSRGGAFDLFWSAYPRKIGKAKAERAWRSSGLAAPDLPRLLAALAAQYPTPIAPADLRYVPHPTTWLHGRRWEDELPPPPTDPYANWPRL